MEGYTLAVPTESRPETLRGPIEIHQYNTSETSYRDSGSHFYLWQQFPDAGRRVTALHVSFSASSVRMVICGHLLSKGRILSLVFLALVKIYRKLTI